MLLPLYSKSGKFWKSEKSNWISGVEARILLIVLKYKFGFYFVINWQKSCSILRNPKYFDEWLRFIFYVFAIVN
jgi:hypothetical protein